MKGNDFFKQVAQREPFTRMRPSVAAFFKDYLSHEKAIKYKDYFVVNTQFPPFPSRAFENLAEHFSQIGESIGRKLYSVTLAVTNRCAYKCWHCYNAGRSQIDVPFSEMKKIAAQLQEMDTVMLTLTGGEPLLRRDLEQIAKLFDERVCIILNTTGDGLTPERARKLRDSGVFGIGVSLDSVIQKEHDKLRGKKGAFATALTAIETASRNGLYPYVISVATHSLIQQGLEPFLKFVAQHGALEVHLLTPCPTGRLSGNAEAPLKQNEKEHILAYQKEVAKRDDLPILSTFLYLESSKAFGCGAGLTHLYIDGGGEVCPCNFVPISFGNLLAEPLETILSKMGKYFRKPRTGCVGHSLNKYISAKKLPLDTKSSIDLCEKYLPREHNVPIFFKIRSAATDSVGQEELQSAYNRIHNYYDEFWLTEAHKPIEELLNRLPNRLKRIFEAGCGTGFATCQLAKKAGKNSVIIAADISEKMLAEAENRARSENIYNIKFTHGDALEILKREQNFDLIFSSWVLGYIPLKKFFDMTQSAMSKNGKLAFVVHKENSPYEHLRIFWQLVADDPSVLKKKVSFDFPRDKGYIKTLIKSCGMHPEQIWDGEIIFKYNSPEEVLDHLLKSGAGTAFYDSLDPKKRKGLEKRFIEILSKSNADRKFYVTHEYISCIARNIS